jgi:peptidoglycan hydrolase-like protein with peptidoglycan-binding domain
MLFPKLPPSLLKPTPGGAAGKGAGGAAGGKAAGPGGAGGHQGARALRKGSTGMDVAHVQNLLNRALPLPPPPLWVDGIFGAKTDRKVREFQMKNRLAVDGVVGPQTKAALESAR